MASRPLGGARALTGYRLAPPQHRHDDHGHAPAGHRFERHSRPVIALASMLALIVRAIRTRGQVGVVDFPRSWGERDRSQ